jgi:hypothetical protein
MNVLICRGQGRALRVREDLGHAVVRRKLLTLPARGGGGNRHEEQPKSSRTLRRPPGRRRDAEGSPYTTNRNSYERLTVTRMPKICFSTGNCGAL